MSNVLKTFGSNLRKLRKSRKLSQEALAEIADCHPNYVGGIERGERNVSLKNIVSLVNALQCDVTELFRGVAVQVGIRQKQRKTEKGNRKWN